MLSFRTHSAALRAGFDAESILWRIWIPAFAGMTAYRFNNDTIPARKKGFFAEAVGLGAFYSYILIRLRPCWGEPVAKSNRVLLAFSAGENKCFRRPIPSDRTAATAVLFLCLVRRSTCYYNMIVKRARAFDSLLG
jgi:hypothetical protein